MEALGQIPLVVALSQELWPFAPVTSSTEIAQLALCHLPLRRIRPSTSLIEYTFNDIFASPKNELFVTSALRCLCYNETFEIGVEISPDWMGQSRTGKSSSNHSHLPLHTRDRA